MEVLGGRPKKVQMHFQLLSNGKSEKGQESHDKWAWFKPVPPECLAWRMPSAATASSIFGQVKAVLYVDTNEAVALWAAWITALFNGWAFRGPICASTSSLLCERHTCANKCIAWQEWAPPSSTHLWHWIYLFCSSLTLGTDCLWHKILKQKYLCYGMKIKILLSQFVFLYVDTTTSQQHKLLQALGSESAATWSEIVTRKAKA